MNEPIRRSVRWCLGRLGRAWRRLPSLDRDLEEAVRFSMDCAKMYIGFASANASDLAGKTLLEIGPGQDLGVVLVMMGHGAEGYVVDPYPCEWRDSFHPAYYRSLREAAARAWPEAAFDALDDVIRRAGHERTIGLHLVRATLEDVREVPTASVDISFSNAALEHLRDHRAACAQLARITKPGGVGFHQVDFRDHRDFDRPLEHLCLTAREAAPQLSRGAHVAYYGSQPRHVDYVRLLRQAGFDVRFEANMFADDAYLEDVWTRVTAEFRALGRACLRVLSGRLFLQKLEAIPPRPLPSADPSPEIQPS